MCTHTHTAVVQGRTATKGYLRGRITVTLLLFNFSTWFFAQIVENCDGRLSTSRPFSNPGDNYGESPYKTCLYGEFLNCTVSRRSLYRTNIKAPFAWDLDGLRPKRTRLMKRPSGHPSTSRARPPRCLVRWQYDSPRSLITSRRSAGRDLGRNSAVSPAVCTVN